MSDLDQRVNELKAQAAALRGEAQKLFDRGNDLQKEATKLESEAAALVVPFKVGDVIEIETHTGYGDHRRKSTFWLKVRNMEVAFQRVEVRGNQVNKKTGALGFHKWIYLGEGWHDKYLRTVKEG